MSENYSPNPEVEPDPPYTTVFLSQRDLGLRVPINFVTSPGVSFTAACFSDQKFEDGESGSCFSNLLAAGFRRFVIDLYWDERRYVWSFCPVAVPTSFPNTQPSPTTAPILSSSNFQVTASPSLRAKKVRQELTTSQVPSALETATALSASSGTSLGEALPSIAVLPDSPNEPLVSIGPFQCTTTINLSTFITQLLDYIQKTETLLGAHILYIIINIHAASPSSSPISAPAAPSSLPDGPNLIGNIFLSNLSAYLYTPTNLASDRANLDDSWYSVPEIYRPAEEYYTVVKNAYSVASTEDGWPAESYVELSKSKRILVGWGTVDPQMAGYNFDGDSVAIFSSGYIHNLQPNINATSDGEVSQGCFLQNTTDVLSVNNSSWASGSMSVDVAARTSLTSLLQLSSNLTSCGISPLLDTPPFNSTANTDPFPYRNISYSTIWSWAPNEPRNFSSDSDAPSDALFRCAASTGRWSVVDCSEKLYAACRARAQPFNWTVASYHTSYSFATRACPSNYTFSAPRTALENAYLTQAMQALSAHRDYDSHGIWVDFNSLDVKGCWVTGGSNATCPYGSSLIISDELRKRVIFVPTIAAIIVLVITILTVGAKLVGNRGGAKRARRQAGNAFFYEGVPS